MHGLKSKCATKWFKKLYDHREEPEMFKSQCVYQWCGRCYKDNGSDDDCDDYKCYYGNDDDSEN